MRAVIVCYIALFCQGCVSQTTLRHAMNTVDSAWNEENREFVNEYGSRKYTTSRNEAFSAAQATVRKLGMVVEQQDPSSGFLYAAAPAPTPLSNSEWETAKVTDTPKLQRITTEEIGFLGRFADIDSAGYEVLMNAFVSEKETKIEISLTVGLRNKTTPALGGVRGTSAPPTAVRLGIEKFWRTYEAELAAIAANRAVPAQPPPEMKAREAKPDQRAKAQEARPKVRHAEANPEYVYETPQRAVPAPLALNQSTIAATGTGFIINRRGDVLTNNHVVDGCSFLTTTRGRFTATLQLAATDPVNDLALVKLSTPSVVAASFRGERSVRSGEPVIVLGYPLQGILASEASTTTGVVSNLAGMGDDTRLLQMTAPVQPGNSGGPVLDAAGNIVGIVVAKLNALQMVKLTGDIPENINFAIKGSVVQSFLEAHGVEYVTALSAKKIETADIAEQAEKFTIRVECRKLTVARSKQESDTALSQREGSFVVAERISDGKKVSLEYTLTLQDGSKVDSNVGKDPLVFTQGAHEIILGLEKNLPA